MPLARGQKLANQTADATEQITRKVNKITEVSEGSISAIREIAKIIEQVNGNAATTASATEEQASTVNEVIRLLDESRHGVDEIVANIAKVASASRVSNEGATDTLSAAESLAEMAVSLKGLLRSVKATDAKDSSQKAA